MKAGQFLTHRFGSKDAFVRACTGMIRAEWDRADDDACPQRRAASPRCKKFHRMGHFKTNTAPAKACMFVEDSAGLQAAPSYRWRQKAKHALGLRDGAVSASPVCPSPSAAIIKRRSQPAQFWRGAISLTCFGVGAFLRKREGVDCGCSHRGRNRGTDWRGF